MYRIIDVCVFRKALNSPPLPMQMESNAMPPLLLLAPAPSAGPRGWPPALAHSIVTGCARGGLDKDGGVWDRATVPLVGVANLGQVLQGQVSRADFRLPMAMRALPGL